MHFLFNGIYLTQKHHGTGFWRFTLNLILELCQRENIQVSAFGPGESPKELVGKATWIAQPELDWNLDSAVRDPKLSQQTFDYIIFPHLVLPKTLPTFTKSIVVVHDLIPTLFLSPAYVFRGKTPLKMLSTLGWAEKYRLKTNLPNLHRVIAGSDSTRKDILRLIKPEQPEKIFSIPYGVDPIFKAHQASDRSGILKQLGLVEKNYFIYFGGHTYRKNVPRLIQATEQLKRKDFPLVILGGGLAAKWVKRISKNPQFLLPGRLHSEDLAKLVAGAKFSIYPTLYEGFGFPLVESLSAGVWPLASDIPTSREILGEKHDFFNPYQVSSIRQAISECINASKVSLDQKVASQDVSRYQWENAVSIFLKNL